MVNSRNRGESAKEWNRATEPKSKDNAQIHLLQTLRTEMLEMYEANFQRQSQNFSLGFD